MLIPSHICALLFACVILFFFNDTATTEIYTLSLHDALPISWRCAKILLLSEGRHEQRRNEPRSEEHTSELQSHSHLVCRLLLEKTKIYIEPAPNEEKYSNTSGEAHYHGDD